MKAMVIFIEKKQKQNLKKPNNKKKHSHSSTFFANDNHETNSCDVYFLIFLI